MRDLVGMCVFRRLRLRLAQVWEMRALRDMQAWPALRLAAVALAVALNAVGCGRSELPVVSPPLSDSGCALEPVI